MKKLSSLFAVALSTLLAFPPFAYSMSADVQTQVSTRADGAIGVMRGGRNGEVVSMDGHSRYQESTYRLNSYICSNLGGTPVTTQAGLSGTTPALTLYNPIASGVAMVVNDFTLGLATAPANSTNFFLAVTTMTTSGPTATTNATTHSALLGYNKSPVGACYRVATLTAAPIAVLNVGSVIAWGNGVPNPVFAPVQFNNSLDGKIILYPGTTLSVQSSQAASITASFSWEEITYP